MSYVDVAAATVAPHGKKLQRLQNATGSVVSASSKLTAGKYATIKVGATPIRVLFVGEAGLTPTITTELILGAYSSFTWLVEDKVSTYVYMIAADNATAYEAWVWVSSPGSR